MAMRQQEIMQRNMIQQAKQSPWYIQESELSKYLNIFSSFDQTGQGFLPA